MGCKCGTQVILCNLPIRFDTYKGCSHGCKYCFVQKKANIAKIQRDETVEALRSFIEGKRGRETAWCDWNIPIHWGGMSDPFQPIEKNIRASYECLKLLAETQYPFVVRAGSQRSRNILTWWKNATAWCRFLWYAANTTNWNPEPHRMRSD